MTTVRAQSVAFGVAILAAIASNPPVLAQLGVGTWVQSSGNNGITLIVEACCNGGRRLTYRFPGSDVVMSLESPFDGTEVPVMLNGKPGGQTMAIKRLDERHTVTVLKMNGKTFGTSKAALSADGRTLTVENEYTSTAGGNAPGKMTETWVRK